MKKILSFLLCVVMICLPAVSCFASTTSITNLQSYFSKYKGYEFDKFNNSWVYYQAWTHEYRDAYVLIGLQVTGDNENAMPPFLYCWIRDQYNREVLQPVEKIQVLIGNDVYVFENVLDLNSQSTVLLGNSVC